MMLSLRFSFYHRRLRIALGYFSSGNNALADSSQIKAQVIVVRKRFYLPLPASDRRLLQGSKTIRIDRFPSAFRARGSAGFQGFSSPSHFDAIGGVMAPGIV
jgi:hypothetical protein